jgi:hypothetical protein
MRATARLLSIRISPFFPSLIEKSIPARACGNLADDGAVRRTLAGSTLLGCAPRFLRYGLELSGAGLPHLSKLLRFMDLDVKKVRSS